MPNGEDQTVIAFSEYPGGPPISFVDRSDEGFEQEIPSDFPLWSRQQPFVPPYVIGSKFHAISHVLASAAYRQNLYLQGFDPRRYDIAHIKSLLAAREPETPATKPVEVKSGESDKEMRKLQERIQFLQSQLESQRPHLQLYRLGAGSLFVAVISLVVWLLTGTGIPFHPIFAAGVIPASLGVIAMGFLIRL